MVTKIDKTSFDLLGKRWSALIIQDLIEGPRRFRELLTHLGRINDKVLSQRLKELEERGIVQRKVFAEVPVRVEYTLTPKGRDLAGVIKEMEDWDTHWAGANGKTRTNGNSVVAGVSSPAAAPVAVAERSDKPRGPFWRRLGL
jgi:DNA-binding HxlR family transcriptional regulator